jgi:hypothetical protein
MFTPMVIFVYMMELGAELQERNKWKLSEARNVLVVEDRLPSGGSQFSKDCIGRANDFSL